MVLSLRSIILSPVKYDQKILNHQNQNSRGFLQNIDYFYEKVCILRILFGGLSACIDFIINVKSTARGKEFLADPHRVLLFLVLKLLMILFVSF